MTSTVETSQGRVNSALPTFRPKVRVKTAPPTTQHSRGRVKTTSSDNPANCSRPTLQWEKPANCSQPTPPSRSSNDSIVDQSDFKSDHYRKKFLSEIRVIWHRIHKDIRNESEVASKSDTDTMSKGSSSYIDNITVSASDTDTTSMPCTVTASDIDTTSPSISEVSVKELPCPQCNIMFPDEHSLRSHLHYHEQYKLNQAKVVGSVEENSEKSCGVKSTVSVLQ